MERGELGFQQMSKPISKQASGNPKTDCIKSKNIYLFAIDKLV
mgnify:CR=1 FL=1